MVSRCSQPSMLQNMDSDWGQNLAGNSFAGNFPPLPEPGNSGSLVALSSARPSSNQYAFNNQQQQDFGGMGGFGSQQPFGAQANGGGTTGLFWASRFNGGQPFGWC